MKKSKRTDADVDYTFAQVGIDKALVDTRGNCGNISSAVGPYAIEAGIVTAQSPTTTVRIYNTNTKKIISEEVSTPNGILTYRGDYHIDGVPGTVVQQVLGKEFDPDRMRIGHPGGNIEAGVDFTCDETTKNVSITSASGFRTARLLLNGQANLD